MPGDATPIESCPETVPQPLDLRAAIESALCRNPQTRQSWAAARSQAALLGQSKAGYLPTVNISLSRTRDAIDTSGGGNTTQITNGRNATLTWLLLDSGTRSANIDQARQSFTAALASHDASLQSSFTTTAQAFYEAWAARAAALAAEESENSARETLAAAEMKSAIGSGTRLEKLQARSALSQAVLARIRADGAHNIAVGTLAANMGMDGRTPLKLAPDPAWNETLAGETAGKPKMPADLDALLGATVVNHPGVQAAQAQLAAALAKLKAVRGEGLPYLSLSVAKYINGRPNTPLTASKTDETLTSLTLTAPLFEGYARNYRIRDAEAQVEARTQELTAVQAQTSLEAWRNYQMLLVETNALSASADLIRAGQEAVDAALSRYRSGSTDILEVLTAQKDLAGAKQERIRALSAWRIARLKMLSSLGRLGLWAVEGTDSNPLYSGSTETR